MFGPPAKGINEDEAQYGSIGVDQYDSGGVRKDAGLLGAYRKGQKDFYYNPNAYDPYFKQQYGDYQKRQLADRQSMMDLYGQLQKQAAGGVTPQQQQMQSGFLQAAQGQQNLANSARGGAYARSAAQGTLTQNAGIQGAQNLQALNLQKARDQMSAEDQMQNVAQAMRAQDLQNMGMESDRAFQDAQNALRGRGLNIQGQLGYAGLEGDALGQNQDAYLGGLRRYYQRNATNDANARGASDAAMQAAGTGLSMLAMFSDKEAKQEAFASGVKHGVMASTFNPADHTPIANLPGYGELYRHNATGAVIGRDPSTGKLVTLKNGDSPTVVETSPPIAENSDLSPAVKRAKNKEMLERVGRGDVASHSLGISPSYAPQAHNAGLSDEAIRSAARPGMLPQAQPMKIGEAADDYARLLGSAYSMDPSAPDAFRSMQQAALERADQGNALVSDASSKKALYDAGAALYAAKQYGAAGDALSASGDPRSLYTAALAYDQANDPAKARSAYEASAKSDKLLPQQIENAQARMAAIDAARVAERGHQTDAIAVGKGKQLPEDRSEVIPHFRSEDEVAHLQQPSPNAIDPNAARNTADEVLNKLSQSQSLYQYKDPRFDTSTSNPGQPHIGVMAQDLERTPVGPSLIEIDPNTGMRKINGGAGLSTAFAGLGRLNERMNRLEKK